MFPHVTESHIFLEWRHIQLASVVCHCSLPWSMCSDIIHDFENTPLHKATTVPWPLTKFMLVFLGIVTRSFFVIMWIFIMEFYLSDFRLTLLVLALRVKHQDFPHFRWAWVCALDAQYKLMGRLTDLFSWNSFTWNHGSLF